MVARAGAAGAPGLRDGQDRLTSAGGESSGLGAQEGAFDEGADAVAFVWVELVERGEVVSKGLVSGAAFVFVEDEVVGGDCEGDGEGAEDVEGGLAGAGFVAADLGDVGAVGVGDGLLGEPALLAEGGESVAELRGERFHAYQPPTVSIPLGYLMPGARYRAWIVSVDDPNASVEDLAAAVREYALPFMESGSTLTALCELMGDRLGFDHQLVYRRPVAWMLAGSRDRAAGLVNAAEKDLGDRDDPAALDLRSFAAAFRRRFLVSSSG